MEMSFHHRKGPRPSISATKEGADSLREEIQREIGEYSSRDVPGLDRV